MVGERLYVTPHFTLHAPHFILHTPHSTLYTFHSTLHTLHFTLCTLHFTLCTLHSTLHTLRSTLYTLHCTLPPQPFIYTLHCPPPTVMIPSPLVNRLLEAQTICSTFGRLLLALQPFAPPSSVSLLIPLQKLSCSEPQRTLLSVELRSSSIFLRLPAALDDCPSFSVVFFYLFPVIPPFSSIFTLFSTIFLHFPWFFLPFSCRSQRT